MSRESCESNNPFCCDDPTTASTIIEGKCEICREKDHKIFIKKKQAELRAKRVAKTLKAKEDDKTELQLAIRELQNEIYSGHALRDTPEETAASTKRNRPSSPQNDHLIKIENDEEPYSYEKLIEAARDAGQMTKKQKKGEACVGDWILVKWHAVKSRHADEVDSAVTDVDSDPNSKNESG
ncbi:hypothetical protein N431DRAFT_456459 [Stipitochalara longipes BDJ]|nr:hypothetical protein N431DRAFT_456459 [Stipitochalara longipes BDJ]